tara:strand:+ start:410 stop:649 length:240 start_codon:yes stop_codon:yes gene_type:complete
MALGRKHKRGSNVSVRPRRNESPERLIKRFTRKVKKLGLIEEVKRRKHYRKPSEIRRHRAIKKKREIAKEKAKAQNRNR